jgi:hypothetical protein
MTKRYARHPPRKQAVRQEKWDCGNVICAMGNVLGVCVVGAYVAMVGYAAAMTQNHQSKIWYGTSVCLQIFTILKMVYMDDLLTRTVRLSAVSQLMVNAVSFAISLGLMVFSATRVEDAAIRYSCEFSAMVLCNTIHLLIMLMNSVDILNNSLPYITAKSI